MHLKTEKRLGIIAASLLSIAAIIMPGGPATQLAHTPEKLEATHLTMLVVMDAPSTHRVSPTLSPLSRTVSPH